MARSATSSARTQVTRSCTWLTFPAKVLLGVLLSVLLQPTAVMGFVGSVSMRRSSLRMSSETRLSSHRGTPESRLNFLSGLVAGGAAALALPLAAMADPPLEKFTKDEICIQRNLNGSCGKFGIEKVAEEVVTVSKKAPIAEEPESELMTTLKKRTAANKVKNNDDIATKTFLNGQSGEFGPFSRYVPVKHKDTGQYELVLIRELDDMKKAGLIANERGIEVFVEEKK